MELLSFKLVLPNFKVHALSFLSSKMQGDTHLFLLFFLRPQWPGECSLKRHARVPNLWLWLAFAVSFSITCLTSSPNNDYYLEFHKDTKFHPSSLLPSLPISFFPSSFLLFFLSLSFSPSCYLLSYPRMHFLNSHSSGNYLSNSSITLFLIIHFYSLWIPKYFICDYFSNTWSHLPHKAVRALRVDSGFISPYIQWRMSSKTICLQEVRDGERKEREKRNTRENRRRIQKSEK